MAITREDVLHLAKLSNISLSEEQIEPLKKDLDNIVGYISQLDELDTEGVEPMSHVHPVSNRFREDIVTNGDEREKILKNAPEERDGAFVVPRTFD